MTTTVEQHPSWCTNHVEDVTYPDAGLSSGYHESSTIQAGGLVVRLVAGEDESPYVEIADSGTTVTVPPSEVSALVAALLSAKSLTEVN